MEEVPRRTSLVPLAFPCLYIVYLIRVEAEGLLVYEGRAGIISIVRWNLCPVIFGFECLNHVHVQTRGFTKFLVFVKQVSSLNPRVRTSFGAFPLERTRKEPRSSVRFWAATGV